MSKVIILQGIPGSGKSSYAEAIKQPKCILSADAYPGLYVNGFWDKSLSGEAHRWCVREMIRILNNDEYQNSLMFEENGYNTTIVIDNTNTRFEDVYLYSKIAHAFYADVEVHFVECQPEVGFARNLHNVPMSTIKKMYDNLVYFHTKYVNRFTIRNVVDGKVVERGGDI